MLAGLGDFLRPPLSTDDSFEAVKGLSGHRPGFPAVRVRTLIRWQGSWQSVTGPTVFVGRATTAVSIMSSLLRIDPEKFLGKLSPTVPAVFDPAGTGVTQEQYEQVLSLVTEALEADRDPVDAVLYAPGRGFYLKEGSGGGGPGTPQGPVVLGVSPQKSTGGALLQIFGLNLAEYAGDTVVMFGAEKTGVIATNSNSIVVLIPIKATTGEFTVSSPAGVATWSVELVPSVSGDLTPPGDYSGVPGGNRGVPAPGLDGAVEPGGVLIPASDSVPSLKGEFTPGGGE